MPASRSSPLVMGRGKESETYFFVFFRRVDLDAAVGGRTTGIFFVVICEKRRRLSVAGIASMKDSLSRYLVGLPEQMARSFVILPLSTVETQAPSRSFAKVRT